VLRAVQVVVDEKLARPILVGRPAVLETRIEKFGLRLKQGEHFDVINPDHDERYRDYWQTYLPDDHAQGRHPGHTPSWKCAAAIA
jgi:malate dehydrogenase (oxaloacetate-decarboxylating)(NADP+)